MITTTVSGNSKAPNIHVIGDIAYDTIIVEPVNLSTNDHAGRNIWAPFREAPGGSGLLAAREAKRNGLNPILYGSLGKDVYAEAIQEYLVRNDIAHKLYYSSWPTAHILIMRDCNCERIIICNKENANLHNAPEIATELDRTISSTDILYVSGYCLVPSSERRASVISLLERMGSRCIKILDVVPHRIYDLLPCESIIRLCGLCDIIISGVNTIKQVIGEENVGPCFDPAEIQNVALGLRSRVKFSNLVLRWGELGCNEQAVFDRNGDLCLITSIDNPSAVGAGDDAFFRILPDLLGGQLPKSPGSA